MKKKLIKKMGKEIRNNLGDIIILFQDVITQIKEGKLNEEESVKLLEDILNLLNENFSLQQSHKLLKTLED